MGEIIIGIDAGGTFAFAALSFDGQLLALRSRRNAKREEIIRLLEPFEPIIIACDTNPPSKLAKSLSAAFKCRLSFPQKSLTISEKYRLVSNYGCRNSHEKDALAAALKAYFRIANKMRQVERHAREMGAEHRLERGRHLVASGKRMEDAL